MAFVGLHSLSVQIIMYVCDKKHVCVGLIHLYVTSWFLNETVKKNGNVHSDACFMWKPHTI